MAALVKRKASAISDDAIRERREVTVTGALVATLGIGDRVWLTVEVPADAVVEVSPADQG